MALKSHLCSGIGSGLLFFAAAVAVRGAFVICVEARAYAWSDFRDFLSPLLIVGLIGGAIVGFLSAWVQTRREIEEKKNEAEKAAAAAEATAAENAETEAELEATKKKAEAAAADERGKAAAEAAAEAAAKVVAKAAARVAAAKEELAKFTKGDEPGWSWQRMLLVWGAIGFGVLFGGGAAARAYMVLSRPDLGLFDLCGFWVPLLLFSAGGGLTIGLLILVWWLVVKMGFNWALGFVVLALVLVGIFVWPTPYRYSDVVGIQDGKKVTTAVLKINRLTGAAEQIYLKEQSR